MPEQQRRLALSRDERLRLLDTTDPTCHGITRRQWHNVRLLLGEIERCGGGTDHSFVRVAVLAARMSVSGRTVQRAARAAEAAGLLVIAERSGHNGQLSHRWCVQWDRLAGGCKNLSPPPDQMSPPGDRLSPPPDQMSPRIEQPYSTIDQPQLVDRQRDDQMDRSNRAGDPEREVVVEEVLKAGVNQAERCVNAALEAGASASDIRAAVRWWREHREGFAHPLPVLYWHLMQWPRDGSPGRDPGSGWPDWVDGYEPPERATARARSRRYRELRDRHRATYDSWTGDFKQRMAAEVVRQHPDLAGDGVGIAIKIFESLESRELYQRFKLVEV